MQSNHDLSLSGPFLWIFLYKKKKKREKYFKSSRNISLKICLVSQTHKRSIIPKIGAGLFFVFLIKLQHHSKFPPTFPEFLERNSLLAIARAKVFLFGR